MRFHTSRIVHLPRADRGDGFGAGCCSLHAGAKARHFSLGRLVRVVFVAMLVPAVGGDGGRGGGCGTSKSARSDASAGLFVANSVCRLTEAPMLRSRLLSEAQVRTVVRSTRHLVSMYTLAVVAKLGGVRSRGDGPCMVVVQDACLVSAPVVR